ncbi:MAG: hypothetical protein AAFY19_00790 [Pseudomonadota bacterium]
MALTMHWALCIFAAAMMNTVRDVFDALGGNGAIAERLSVPYPTATSWVTRNSIPAKHWPDIVEFADELGVAVSFKTLGMIARARKNAAA